jgi:hypothetical protein
VQKLARKARAESSRGKLARKAPRQAQLGTRAVSPYDASGPSLLALLIYAVRTYEGPSTVSCRGATSLTRTKPLKCLWLFSASLPSRSCPTERSSRLPPAHVNFVYLHSFLRPPSFCSLDRYRSLKLGNHGLSIFHTLLIYFNICSTCSVWPAQLPIRNQNKRNSF